MVGPSPPWQFRCYVSPEGRDEIRAWYESEGAECKGKFVARLRALHMLPIDEWKLPLFRWLRGDGAPLGEIRFKANRIQQRPLGFRSGEDKFTLLFVAQEKSDHFVPRNACEIAISRMAEVIQDAEHRSIHCWLFNDPRASNPPRIGGQGAPRLLRGR